MGCVVSFQRKYLHRVQTAGRFTFLIIIRRYTTFTYRLYFLCENKSRHSRPAYHFTYEKNRFPHSLNRILLTVIIVRRSHEGYLISRPKEFFRKYGQYLRDTFPMICQALTAANGLLPGIGIAGAVLGAVPAVIPNDRSARVEQLCNTADSLVKKVNNVHDNTQSLLHKDHKEGYYDGLRELKGLALNEVHGTSLST